MKTYEAQNGIKIMVDEKKGLLLLELKDLERISPNMFYDIQSFVLGLGNNREKMYAFEELHRNYAGYEIREHFEDAIQSVFSKENLEYIVDHTDFPEIKSNAEIILKGEIPYPKREFVRNSQTSFRVPRKGYIYLIFLEKTNSYKIGRAINLESRLETFGVKFPEPIITIHTYFSHDYIEEEKRLHSIFKSKRITGEWFSLEKEDVEYICSIKGDDE